MWKVYGLLESGIPKQDEKYFLHETIKIMEGISNYNFKQVLATFYGKNFYHGKLPIDFAILFVDGIKKNNLIDFVHFVRSINGSS